MGLTTRELPVAEWPRLEATDLKDHWLRFSPASCRVMVVEDAHQTIVGTWVLLTWLHVEGLWVHPDHRRRGGVFRSMLRTMGTWVRAAGAGAAITGSVSDDVTRMCQRFGATRIPGETYLVPFAAARRD